MTQESVCTIFTAVIGKYLSWTVEVDLFVCLFFLLDQSLIKFSSLHMITQSDERSMAAIRPKRFLLTRAYCLTWKQLFYYSSVTVYGAQVSLGWTFDYVYFIYIHTHIYILCIYSLYIHSTKRCVFFWVDDASSYFIPSFQCWGLKFANGQENQRDYIKIHSHPTQSCTLYSSFCG